MYRIFLQVRTSTLFRENTLIQRGKVHAHGYKSESWEEIKFQEACWLNIFFIILYDDYFSFSLLRWHMNNITAISLIVDSSLAGMKKRNPQNPKTFFNITWHSNLYMQGEMKQESPIIKEESLKLRETSK